jgi:uncharacterized repeat protein (TIGR03803 family)
MRNLLLDWVAVPIVAVLAMASLAPPNYAAEGALKTLYNFCTQSISCTDGNADGNPLSDGVIIDAAGHLYGTTALGGLFNGTDCMTHSVHAPGCGVVFELAPNVARTRWMETVLYSFCAQGGVNCTDGESPDAALIMDKTGDLYGTTLGGGAHGGGTVFQLTPKAAKTQWTEAVLYSFCAQGGVNCTDGSFPSGGLIMDAAGRLYGAALSGGAGGTVFELTPNGAKTQWTETVLYSFCAQGGVNCTDGGTPSGGLIMDAAGRLYGTTDSGGALGFGTVFQLTPNGVKTKWTETVPYSFCAQGNCTDGSYPSGSLIMDKAGRLYGTTQFGGAHGGGTVFELTPNATKTQWAQTLLYSFCARGANCTDGSFPPGGLIMDAAGRLYGTTDSGGALGFGTVFQLTPNGAKTKWTEAVLYSFCAQGGVNCTDGSYPSGGLIMDKAGRLYGTTQFGGAHGGGTVFELPLP